MNPSKVALDKIEKFGREMTYIHYGDESYNVETGENIRIETEFAIFGIIESIRDREKILTTIISPALNFSIVPKIGDKIQDYRVKNIQSSFYKDEVFMYSFEVVSI